MSDIRSRIEKRRAQLKGSVRQRIEQRRAQLQADAPKANPDGTYGEVPEDMVFDPERQSYTTRENMMAQHNPGALEAAGHGFMQGYAMNMADEAVSPTGGFQREKARAQLDASQDQRPGAYAAGQIAGAIASPVNKLLGPIKSVKGAAAVAGAEGAASAMGDAEGGFVERVKAAPMGAASSALFGGASAGVIKIGSPAFRRMFEKSVKRPTVGNLYATKNAAYKAVEDSGEVFSKKEMSALFRKVTKMAKDADFDDIADPQSRAALEFFKRRKTENLSITRLDKMRQNLWSRYNRSDEPLVLDMIGAIDELIDSRAASSELMQAARLANKKYAKAELLENAFKKARLQTASTGSGGNILNKYRQAVTRIITNPKEAKWFDAEELALMERFVEGDDVENVLRRGGKLAPGGNGLMTALNVYAAAVDPSLLAVTGAASLAKGAADKSAMRGSEAVLDAVSTGIIPAGRPAPNLGPAAIGVGVAGSDALRR